VGREGDNQLEHHHPHQHAIALLQHLPIYYIVQVSSSSDHSLSLFVSSSKHFFYDLSLLSPKTSSMVVEGAAVGPNGGAVNPVP